MNSAGPLCATCFNLHSSLAAFDRFRQSGTFSERDDRPRGCSAEHPRVVAAEEIRSEAEGGGNGHAKPGVLSRNAPQTSLRYLTSLSAV